MIKKNKKAQQAIIGVVMAVVLLGVFASTLPIWFEFVSIGVNASVNQTNGQTIQVILYALPLFAALVVLVAIVIMITGR
jgi:hypothetical protein